MTYLDEFWTVLDGKIHTKDSLSDHFYITEKSVRNRLGELQAEMYKRSSQRSKQKRLVVLRNFASGEEFFTIMPRSQVNSAKSLRVKNTTFKRSSKNYRPGGGYPIPIFETGVA